MATKWLDSALRRQKQDVDAGEKSNSVQVVEQRALADVEIAPKLDSDDDLKTLLEIQRRTREAPKTASEPPDLDLDEESYAILKPAVEVERTVEVKQAVAVQPTVTPKISRSTQGDLMSTEDIYRAAGILNPRMGYSINKVAEMIDSDHMRGLSKDAKRAALLMALDAAGISIDEVLRDAASRQSALNTYEADQQRSFEENWTRKAERNDEIQSELGRLTAQYLDRIKRNLDEVASEKAALARWQAMKQLETQRIADAVALCSKSASVEEIEDSQPATQGKVWGPAASRRKAAASRSETPD